MSDLQKHLDDDALTERALALYTAPFRFRRGYIWDAQNNMVADDDTEEVALRVRGWGRMSYMENAEALQDRVGELIAKAMTDYWDTHTAALTRGAKEG